MKPAVQVTALLLIIITHNLGVRAPNPPPSKADKLLRRSLFEKYVRKLKLLTQVPITTFLMVQCFVISLNELNIGQEVTSKLCPLPSTRAIYTVSRLELLGIAIMTFAAVLRTWCIRTLGQFFTYEMTIRPNHKLIKSGPYGYVRHPGYICSVLILAGSMLLISFSPSTYLRACGIKEIFKVARWLDHLWDVWVLYVCYSLLTRGAIEDANLKAQFGTEWEEYRRKVPYKFIPGIV